MIFPRRNKLGKIFSFVRFIEVEDLKSLAIWLDSVMFDGKKIHAKPPRFLRNGSKEGDFVSKGKLKVLQNEKTYVRREGADVNRGGKSFADLVANRPRVSEQEAAKNLIISSKEETILRLKKAFIGEVHSPGSSFNMQTNFEMEGYFQVKVSPMRPNHCLLEEIKEGDIQALIEEGVSWWSLWFKNISPWKEDIVDKERVVWIRILGIPC